MTVPPAGRDIGVPVGFWFKFPVKTVSDSRHFWGIEVTMKPPLVKGLSRQRLNKSVPITVEAENGFVDKP